MRVLNLKLVQETPRPYRLLGAEVSYYTAKIRAYLVHKQLPFADVLATRQVFQELILPRVGWPVIPVLLTPSDETLQDTSDMVDALEARHPQPALVPVTPVRRFAALLFELYADEWLKVPALHYRWYYDRDFAVMEFGRNNDPERSPEAQRHIGEKIAAPFASWPQALGATHAAIPAIEADYLGLLADLNAHFTEHTFLFGATPTLADCALYGPFHAHLFRDPNSGKVMRAHAPRVIDWIYRMQVPSKGHETPPSDTVPASLWPALWRLSAGYVPILAAQLMAQQKWLAENPAAPIPRVFGTHLVTFGQTTTAPRSGPRALFSYDLWMWQRALAVWERATPADQTLIAEFATAIGAAPLLSLVLPQRLRRENYRLVRAAAA